MLCSLPQRHQLSQFHGESAEMGQPEKVLGKLTKTHAKNQGLESTLTEESGSRATPEAVCPLRASGETRKTVHPAPPNNVELNYESVRRISPRTKERWAAGRGTVPASATDSLSSQCRR